MYKCAVLTISDSCFQKAREDTSGPAVMSLVKTLPAEIVQYAVLPDDLDAIAGRLQQLCDETKVDLILTTGGTGFFRRDVTPEATRKVIEREVPGIPEVMRAEGLKSTRRAMLSRGLAGLRGTTLIINLPGSPRGAGESLSAVMDQLGHSLDMIAGRPHQGG
ncbi:MAG: MogA/MoaB family molybdenum cofactor biosynthesis protein [Candidatus Omnitrophota bacterium]|jgi:molybdenum cofactor synthesis domain-containing protein